MSSTSSERFRRRAVSTALILLVAISSVLVTFNQPLADWWGQFPIGRLTGPLGGFDVHVAMWFLVGITLLRLVPNRGNEKSQILGFAFLASLIFEIAQPMVSPRNFEAADLAANVVGLFLAGWWCGRKTAGE